MPLRDKEAGKYIDGVLQAMNELTGWESRQRGKGLPPKEVKRDKK